MSRRDSRSASTDSAGPDQILCAVIAKAKEKRHKFDAEHATLCEQAEKSRALRSAFDRARRYQIPLIDPTGRKTDDHQLNPEITTPLGHPVARHGTCAERLAACRVAPQR